MPIVQQTIDELHKTRKWAVKMLRYAGIPRTYLKKLEFRSYLSALKDVAEGYRRHGAFGDAELVETIILSNEWRVNVYENY